MGMIAPDVTPVKVEVLGFDRLPVTTNATSPPTGT
jgi:hypothetical protein